MLYKERIGNKWGDATLLTPVSTFNGVDSKITVPSDKHLIPVADGLYATRSNPIEINSVGKMNVKSLDLVNLDKVLAMDTSISQSLKLIFNGDVGNVTKWYWGDGTFSLITHTGNDVAITHTYNMNDKVLYLYAEDVNYTTFRVENSKDAILGELGEYVNLTYLLNLGGCNLITGDLASISNLTYYLNLGYCNLVTGDLASVSNLTNLLSLDGCNLITVNAPITLNVLKFYANNNTGLSAVEIERIVTALDNNGKSNGILELGGTTVSPNANTLTLITTLRGKGWTVTHNS